MKDQKQEPMFPEIDLENIDAGDLIGVTDWQFPRGGEIPTQNGWYEVNDFNSAVGSPEEVERRQLVQRAFWCDGDWMFPSEKYVVTGFQLLQAGQPYGHITVANIVWRGLKAPWPAQE